MAAGSKPGSAINAGVQRTLPDVSDTFGATDTLNSAGAGNYDLRGKWIYVWGAGTIKRDVVGAIPLPLSAAQVLEFWVDVEGGSTGLDVVTTGTVYFAFDSEI